jgi:hypothetical protein
VPEDDGSEVVTEVKTDKLYTMECQPNDGHSARFISDNDGTVNGQTAKGTKFRFEAAPNGGYYIKSTVSGKYINANDGKTDISFDAEPKSAWTVGQLSKSDAYVYFTIGGNKYLNNHQGGEDNLRLATHNPIGQNNKCSLWTLHQYDDETTGVTSVKPTAESKDGIYVQDEEVVIVRNSQRYNLKGQNLK